MAVVTNWVDHPGFAFPRLDVLLFQREDIMNCRCAMWANRGYLVKSFRIEIFVFSTHLEPLTEYFQLKNFEITLESISLHFAGWSGGTKIGQAIETLNESYPASVNSKTVAVIMSDGWDTGDADLLEREMAKLSNRARSVIWINPLKGDPSYEPLAIGMSTVRPYCNDFISGHSLKALETFVDLIKP